VILRKAVARVRARGLREVWNLSRERIREQISSGDTLLFLVRSAEHVGTDDTSLIFKQAEASDAELYARDIGTDSAATFQRRLTVGTRCFLVTDGGKLLHASWVATDRSWAREIRAYLVPPPGSEYVYESFTRADARGRGIYPFALKNIVSIAAKDGLEKVWIAVEADNEPSKKAISKAGFELAFEVSYRRRWGRLTIDAPTGPEAETGKRFIHQAQGREK
jgi:RimJ/RimL family protein N-acetyltransferase